MIIQSKRILIEDKIIDGQLEIEEGRIKNFYSYNKEKVDIDFANYLIVPGFYDIHCHGYEGFDCNDGSPEGLLSWLKNITREGVCGICPTTVTDSKERLLNALKNVKEVYNLNPYGAKILGIHFEGPYLSKEFKGAQPEEYIVEADVDEFVEYVENSGNLIKIITLAPEHDKNFELINYCKNNNINVSLGHSASDYKMALDAIKAGAKGITHTFNGMADLNHHKPTLIDAALLADSYCEIICDGRHVSLSCLELLFRVKDINKIIMISDALMAKNLPIGSEMIFGSQKVRLDEDGVCRLESGKLAGSTLKINEGLKLLVEKLNIPLHKAIKTCTVNPAKYLGLKDRGEIKPNYIADLTILDDYFNVISTFVEGNYVKFS